MGINFGFISSDAWAHFEWVHNAAYHFLLHASLTGEYLHLRDKANASVVGLNPYERKRLVELTQWNKMVNEGPGHDDEQEDDRPDTGPDESNFHLADGESDEDDRDHYGPEHDGDDPPPG